jgi:preprotein translocase subunit SecA
LSRVQIRAPEDVEAVEEQRRKSEQVPMQFQHEEAETVGGDVSELPPMTSFRESEKVGRNDPCPCGSGKKYKQCHGKLS